MLFNEPKLLKSDAAEEQADFCEGFSALQRAEIAEIVRKSIVGSGRSRVSVLFNEPKLLKLSVMSDEQLQNAGFSALQRAEIAEMRSVH